MNSLYMSTRTPRLLMYVLLLSATILSYVSASAQFSIAAGSTNYTENFNSLTGTAGTAWTNNSTLTGWYVRTTATASITTYGPGTGTTSAAGLYSFASTPTTDRAFGFITTNAFTGAAGTGFNYAGWRLVNNTGGPITAITVSYRGEQYRNNGTNAAQPITVSYLTGSNLTDLLATGFTAVSALTFNSPVFSATAAAVDGNVAGLVTLSTTIDLSGSPLANGSEILIRFGDLNDSGNDHTLAIDDVTINATVSAPSGNDNLSDIVFDSGFTTPANINYALYQEADLTSSSLEIARFTIRDGAGSSDVDAVATTLNAITFTPSNGGIIRRLAIYDGTTEVAEIAGGASAIFSGLFGLVAADNGTKTFSLRASFNATVTDNTQFGYTVFSTSYDPAGSGFAASNAGAAASSTAGDDNRIEVTATAVYISTQPIGTTVNTAMANVVAFAGDALGNRDQDYTTDFSLTSTGTLTGSPVTATPALGIATFSGLTHTAVGSGLTLSITSGAFPAAISNTFNISGPPIIAWDFFGIVTTPLPVSYAATTIDANLSAVGGNSDVTRGPNAAASSGANSFRTTSFSNNGIANTNTDYFQVTLVPVSGYKVSLSSIDANLVGTASFAASPGVTSQFAYSLDGVNFTLIGSPAVTIGSPASLPQIDVSGISALQDVSGTIYLRYYASGQTTTGGWGFNSASAGTNGLAIGGTVEALECNDPSACNYNVTATSAVDCIYATLYYVDADNDGFAGTTETTCTPGVGYTTTVLPVTDCDDTNNAINTSASEVSCNGIDDDCDSSIDEGDIVGCQDPIASNYNPAATCPGACSYGGSWTAGNLVALRGGNGVDNIAGSTTSTVVFLEQITPAGSTVSTLPLTTNGPTRLSQASISTAEGFITRTSNGDGIVVAGYDQPAGVTNVTAAGLNAARVANFVDASYNVSRLFSSTSIHSGNNIRSATKNGSNTWTAGANQGINYAGSGTPAIISTTSTNTRVVKEFGGNLYFTTGGGTRGLYRIQNGLATSGSNTADIVIATGGSSSPYDFEFSPDGNTVYIADDTNGAVGGVYKYTFNGTSWVLEAQYTITGYLSVSSIAVDFSTATPTIYAVSRSATETIIVSFADNEITGPVTATTLKTTTSATAVYRSIDFVPCNGTTWFRDADGDGFGDASNPYVDCIQPFGYVANNTDCNDAVATIYPGATEICNGLDDDCDLTIDDSCITPPANDNRASATLLAGNAFPTCGTTNGNLLSATNSVEATSTEPVGAGQDVWYRFVAQTNGVRIQATNNSGLNDLVIELQNNDGTQIIAIENETTTGNEILVANNLVPGQTYFAAVRNFNTSTRGAFTVCIQHLTASQPNNGTSFNNLCGFIKSKWNGASLYSVTFDDGVNAPISASGTSTQIPFSWLSGVRYNTTYNVTFTTTFNINDAAGNPTTVVVNSAPYVVNILQHQLVELRSLDRCPNTRLLNAYVTTTATICGSNGFQWEVELVDENNDPIGIEGPVTVNTTSRYLKVNQIPGVQAGQRYRVRVRPTFSYGTGVYAPGYQYLCITGAANMEMTEEFMAPAQRSLTSEVEVGMNVYPNPNRGDVFTVRAGGLVSEQVFVRIMDIAGREVYSSGFAVDGVLNATLQMTSVLQSGIYMIELTDGTERFVQRMIVE